MEEKNEKNKKILLVISSLLVSIISINCINVKAETYIIETNLGSGVNVLTYSSSLYDSTHYLQPIFVDSIYDNLVERKVDNSKQDINLYETTSKMYNAFTTIGNVNASASLLTSSALKLNINGSFGINSSSTQEEITNSIYYHMMEEYISYTSEFPSNCKYSLNKKFKSELKKYNKNSFTDDELNEFFKKLLQQDCK